MFVPFNLHCVPVIVPEPAVEEDDDKIVLDPVQKVLLPVIVAVGF